MSKPCEVDTEVNALYYSRPLSLPGRAFGCLSFFFDPNEIKSEVIEKLGKYLTDVIEDYFITLEKTSGRILSDDGKSNLQ